VSKLPGSQTRGIAALALFMGVQVADGVCTASGIARFGPGVEANPILYFLLTTCGMAGALVSMKLVAILSGAFLYSRSQNLTLSLLTVLYVFGAILPWAWTLST
jgi:uncharacterized protein DUF5658